MRVVTNSILIVTGCILIYPVVSVAQSDELPSRYTYQPIQTSADCGFNPIDLNDNGLVVGSHCERNSLGEAEWRVFAWLDGSTFVDRVSPIEASPLQMAFNNQNIAVGQVVSSIGAALPSLTKIQLTPRLSMETGPVYRESVDGWSMAINDLGEIVTYSRQGNFDPYVGTILRKNGSKTRIPYLVGAESLFPFGVSRLSLS